MADYNLFLTALVRNYFFDFLLLDIVVSCYFTLIVYEENLRAGK